MNIDIGKELQDIRNLILCLRRPNVYRAKIQKCGTEKNGSQRFMIYVTRAVKENGLKPGDKIEFSVQKFEKPIEIAENTLTNDEIEFLKKYRRLKEENEIMAEMLKEQAKKTFGEKRTEELTK